MAEQADEGGEAVETADLGADRRVAHRQPLRMVRCMSDLALPRWKVQVSMRHMHTELKQGHRAELTARASVLDQQ